MTIEPVVVIGFITAILGLLAFILRQFMAGKIHSDQVVPREDYEAAMAIGASYATAITALTEAVAKLTATVDRVVPPNGVRS